ncbi:aryl-alcohol dehydrogenase-like predicted oxidoreductase [Hydrotalea sandarakina]|jgi:aryl-alcohol dehydrogenase-like predicted oxidoreductase|uniref:Aryl-alcohol dehydrogenase-like predicted oxidoreductase n=2 Tax=Hydrotalea sandarakina TaxID=1004304 RepID=A0A2W7RQ83_9BACT|nr:aryl-alcohol dehydrogenase-like predicted oxidoreductase [Hydrotalea sandarakina]
MESAQKRICNGNYLKMQKRKLGKDGPEVSAISIGTSWGINSLTEWYQSKKQLIKTLQLAIDSGINFINTADFYGCGISELTIGEVIKERRKDVFISVKTGAVINPNGHLKGLDGSPKAIKNYCAYSLKRLGVDEIDLYQPCRIDPEVPIEETVGAIKDLIAEGKVKYLGLSEANAEQLIRANKIHKVSALEIEYSLATRFVEYEILQVARNLGTAIVPYSVFSYGLLTGKIKFPLLKNDFRNILPRFENVNLKHNLKMVEWLKKFAETKNASASQIALAWLLNQGTDIIPIIGMTKPERIKENIEALQINFTKSELQLLDKTFTEGAFKGERYPPAFLSWAAS